MSNPIDKYLDEIIITEAQIKARVAELGAEISRDYAGKDLLLLGILKGSVVFLADLMRHITIPHEIDLIAISSYGRGVRESTGVVRLVKDLDEPVLGKHLLIVEDIIDTGHTLNYLTQLLSAHEPASLKICTLLNKSSRRVIDIPVDYVGFDIEDKYVLGYGLDMDEKFRNLPYIGTVKPSAEARMEKGEERRERREGRGEKGEERLEIGGEDRVYLHTRLPYSPTPLLSTPLLPYSPLPLEPVMSNVVCMGELLIDFVPTQPGVSLVEAPAFKKAPGGAPANVAVGLARLGATAAFMGKVGDDDFGHFLAQTLRQNGVNVAPLRFSGVARTALAFVSLRADGERDFMFYRHPSADMLFEPSEVDEAAIRAAKIFHYGSISLISEPSKAATERAIDLARRHNLLISYDPNLRLPLWPSSEAAKEGLLAGWQQAQVIKASDEEIAFLTGQADLAQGARRLWHNDLRLVVVTQGRAGCAYFTPETQGSVSGFEVQTIDTTGAGDGFVAGLLYQLLNNPALPANIPALERALRFANAVGALTTTQLGAIPALPNREVVEELLDQGET